ncbi:MAG: hypothetical protein ACI9NT_002769, partial [Bacteroidia bacterium]
TSPVEPVRFLAVPGDTLALVLHAPSPMNIFKLNDRQLWRALASDRLSGKMPPLF